MVKGLRPDVLVGIESVKSGFCALEDCSLYIQFAFKNLFVLWE